MMKAIVIEKYGQPDTLELKDIDKPIPKKNEVLIKIHATAINDYDWSFVRGKPYIYRLMFGITKPKRQIPGMELSGTVEMLGEDVQAFQKGDAVYGDISAFGFGSFAEFICINEKALVKKPKIMTFEEAASIPHAALLALQALQDIGKISERQKVLINGAGGGVGTFGVQLAKQYGCEVTGVDTGEKLDMMKSIGFDSVLDYTREDFTKVGRKFDLILDCKTNRNPFAYIRSLNPKGIYVTVGGNLLSLFLLFLFRKLISFFTHKNFEILALEANKYLDQINELSLQGKLKSRIDGPYPFADIPRLIQYFGEGKHKGKVVIKVA